MDLDQQVAETSKSNVTTRQATIYDENYSIFVENALKEAASDFEREKKCM